MLITMIETETIDCVVVTVNDIIFVNNDKLDGSIKGEHKVVGRWPSVYYKIKVRIRLREKENKCITKT